MINAHDGSYISNLQMTSLGASTWPTGAIEPGTRLALRSAESSTSRFRFGNAVAVVSTTGKKPEVVEIVFVTVTEAAMDAVTEAAMNGAETVCVTRVVERAVLVTVVLMSRSAGTLQQK